VEAPRINQKSPLLLNLEQAVKVLTMFIERELHRTGLQKAIIGLSGGVDSALSTYLTAKAIGPENLHVVMMPYKTSSADSLSHARLIVDDLKLSHEVVEITEMADALFAKSPDIDRMRRGNIMARCRMITLYDRSQQLNGLVIGTSNKTESLLGYTTLFGDNASAINPLGDLYKTQVWQLSEYIGMPKEIVSKPPSADLWEGQTDEAEMSLTYREVDELLFHMIDVREDDEQLVRRGFTPEFVAKIRQKIVRTQFKRRPPVIAKISNRTINVDFRYPRDWNT
jgi:NAD+ synthase